MADDKLTFRILEDGTIRIVADGISGVNHASADALVRGVEGLLAGKVTVARRGDHAHAHAHDHAHDHKHETQE